MLARLADAATQVVSLTITEGGYRVDPSTGEFDLWDPDVAHDLEHPQSPSTVFGYIVEALRRRRAAGLGGFTVMSCDNIQGNGDVAYTAIRSFADEVDPELGEWVAESVSFPNSMVDRITPVTTNADRAIVREQFGINDEIPVMAEPFAQWVLEDDFVGERPDFAAAGIQLVDDVAPNCTLEGFAHGGESRAGCYWLRRAERNPRAETMKLASTMSAIPNHSLRLKFWCSMIQPASAAKTG